MIVHDKLKINTFREVSVPSNKDLFMRVGLRPLPEMADGQVAEFTNGAIDELDAAQAYVIKESQMPLSNDNEPDARK